MENPRKLVAAAFELLRSNDYPGLAALCDPLSLRSFKAQMLQEFDYEAFATEKADSNTPAIELTDEQYAEYCKYMDPVRLFQDEFPTLSSIGDLRNLEPEDAFAAWMQGKSRYGLNDDDASAERWKDVRPDRSSPEYEVIGCVFGSPDIAYVLYQNRLSAATSTGYREWITSACREHREFMEAMHHRGEPWLVTCRREPHGTWRLVAKRHFLTFGSFSVTELRTDDTGS